MVAEQVDLYAPYNPPLLTHRGNQDVSTSENITEFRDGLEHGTPQS